MKLRELINNNADKYTANVYENNHKIVVVKNEDGFLVKPYVEEYEFNTTEEYRNWLKEQTWIRKIKKISDFRKVI